MYRNTRYDAQDYSALGLGAGRMPTQGRPLSVVNGKTYCAGSRFYIVGHHIANQTWGSLFSSSTRAEIDTIVADWVATGVNAVCVMQQDQHGLARPNSSHARRPVGCWDNGMAWESGLTWAAGDTCYYTDTSGFTRVTRRYYCDTGGAGSTGSTGPTGTNLTINGITDGSAKWHYLGAAYQSYNEQFWTGDGTAAGFDYFMDACGRAGIYVMIRFDQWVTLFQKLNGGYQLNGSAGGSGGNLATHRFLWPLNGTGGTVNLLQAFLDHLDQWLTRVNSVNGRRYADDHTLLGFDPLNEQGMANAFFSSSDSAGSNTWDYFCKVGSTTPGSTEPVSAIVAWWDAKFLAWYQATYGSTPAVDYGKANTLPVYRYGSAGVTGTLGPNVAARDRFYDGTVAGGWVVRVARFIREVEAEFCTTIKNHVRSRSAHALRSFGQAAYVFQSTLALGDFCDNHFYPNATVTDSNNATTSVTGGSGASAIGATWAANELKLVFSAAQTALVGQSIRFLQTSGGSFTEVCPVASLSQTNIANDTINLTRVGDPGGLASTAPKASFKATFPTVDNNTWPFHNATAGDAANTRMHYWDAATPTTESNYDRAGGWAGQSGAGTYNTLRDCYLYGKAAICTELGERGLAGPQKGLYRTAYTLFDLLQGGSGGFHFSWVNGFLAPTNGEHNIPGDGASWIDAIAMTLMVRCVGELPNEDIAHIADADIDALFGRKNSTDTAWTALNGQSAGYSQYADYAAWRAIAMRRLKLALDGTSVPSAWTVPSLPNTGWTNPDLASASTGLLFWWYNFGTLIYENSKCAIIMGRIPTDTAAASPAPLPLPISKLQCATSDGLAWYGRVMWLSLDGSDLGVGRSVLITYCYPRDQSQVARRFFVDSGPTGRVEMLDGDDQPDTDSSKQPGVVMRNGLRVKLTMAGAKAATVPERYGAMRTHGAHYKSGALWINPSRPLIVLG
jgi:hypothetical protein